MRTIELRLRPDRTDRLEALLVGAGPHLVPVVDVGSAPNGDLVVLVPAPAARLADLLAEPGGLTAGEAVTVLVPLARALARLHAAGAAHGGVRADAVLLDADGSPSWSAPIAPALLRRAGPAAFAERTATDVADLRALGEALLAPSGARMPEGDDLEALAGALFSVAAPEPVRLRRPAPAVVAGPPARLLPAAPDPVPASRRRDRVPAVLDRLRTAAGGVRPRAWIALGGVAALLVTAVVLLPSGPAPAAAPERTRSAPRPGGTTAPGPVAPTALPAEQAVRRLLAARDACLERGSSTCLEGVDAPGSPVLAADRAAVRAGSASVRVAADGLRVTEHGGTALGTGAHGTVLAVRLPNGWRLRDVVAEPPA